MAQSDAKDIFTAIKTLILFVLAVVASVAVLLHLGRVFTHVRATRRWWLAPYVILVGIVALPAAIFLLSIAACCVFMPLWLLGIPLWMPIAGITQGIALDNMGIVLCGVIGGGLLAATEVGVIYEVLRRRIPRYAVSVTWLVVLLLLAMGWLINFFSENTAPFYTIGRH